MIPALGLCETCVWQRPVVSGRGSQFVLCERSKLDANFVRYPPLPVLQCPGFQSTSGDATP